MDHTVDNASCYVQSLSNYNSLNHALSLYVDVHSDQLSSTINSEYMAQNHDMNQVDRNDQYSSQISQIEKKASSSQMNHTNGHFSNGEVIETKELSRNRSEIEMVQLKQVRIQERVEERNGNRTVDDLSNKENEENFENEEYTKVPVKDLISTFEKQTRPVIRYKLREDKLPEPSKMTIGVSTDEMKQTVSSFEIDKFEQSNGYSCNQNDIEFHDQCESSNNGCMNGNCENKNADTNVEQGKRFSVLLY